MNKVKDFKVKGLSGEYTIEDFENCSLDKLDAMIEDIAADQTKNWSDEDRRLIGESMKDIFSLPVEKAVYQARKWALLEARASTVKMNTQKERKEYFDREINHLDYTSNLIPNNNE